MVFTNISTKKTTITLDATSGVHDQAFTGIGFQPTGAIFWGTLQTALETYNEAYSHSYGFSDGTTSCCIANAAVDNVATLDSSCMIRNDACIELLNTAAGNAEIVRAKVKTWDSDGFTLTYNAKTNTTQYKLHVLLFSGTDLSIKAKVETSGRNTTGTQGYTGYGFQPNVIFLAGVNNATQNTLTAASPFGIGAATSSTNTFCYNCFEADNISANTGGAECTGMWNNRTLVCQNTGSVSTFQFNVTLSTMDTDGFTLTHNNAAAATTFPFIVFAIKGGYWDFGAFTQRSGAGTTTFTSATTARPVAFLVYGQDLTTINTQNSAQNTDMGPCIGASDGTSEGYTLYGNSMINTPSRQAMFSSTDKIIRNATIAATATSSTTTAQADSSLSVDGQATLSYTSADANARRCAYLFLQKDVVTQQDITKSLTASVVASVTPVRLNNKIRTGSATVSLVVNPPTRLKTHNSIKTQSTSILVVATRARLLNKTRALSRPITVVQTAYTRLTNKFRTLTRPITIVAALTRPTAKKRATSASLLVVATRARLVAKIRARTATIFITQSSLVRLAQKIRTRSATITIIGTSTRLKSSKKTLSRPVTITSQTLARLAAKTRARTATVTVTQTAFTRLVKKIRILSRTVTITANSTFVKLRTQQRSLSATLTITGNINRLLAKSRTLSRTMTISALRNRLVARTRQRTATVTVTANPPSNFRSKLRSLSRVTTITASNNRLTQRTRSLVRTVTITGNVTYVILFGVKQVTKTINQTLLITGTSTKLIKKIRSATAFINIAATRSRVKSTAKTLSRPILVSSTLAKLKVKQKLLNQNITISGSTTRLSKKIRLLTPAVLHITDHLQLGRIKLEIVWVSEQLSYVKTHIRHIEIPVLQLIDINEQAKYTKGLHKFLSQSVHIGPHFLSRLKFSKRTLFAFVTIKEKLRIRKATPGLITKRGMNRTILDMKITTQSSNSRDLQQYPVFSLWVHNIIRTLKFRRYPT